MTAPGFDVDSGHRFDREKPTIEFHLSFPFQNQINLSQPLMIMCAGIHSDIYRMQTGDRAWQIREGTARESAGTALGRNFIEL